MAAETSKNPKSKLVRIMLNPSTEPIFNLRWLVRAHGRGRIRTGVVEVEGTKSASGISANLRRRNP